MAVMVVVPVPTMRYGAAADGGNCFIRAAIRNGKPGGGSSRQIKIAVPVHGGCQGIKGDGLCSLFGSHSNDVSKGAGSGKVKGTNPVEIISSRIQVKYIPERMLSPHSSYPGNIFVKPTSVATEIT